MKRAWMKWAMTAVMIAVVVPMTGLAQGYYGRYHRRGDGINERQRDQRARIRQGVRSGELTRREARYLQAQQRRIRFDEARARRSGGVFTPRERARIQRDLNRSSRNIYRQKNDRQDRW
jgi:hypothetical protein